MRAIKTFLSGWKECNFEQYKEAYALFGGGVSTHPNIISFLNKHLDEKFTFYSKTTEDGIKGSYFSLNNMKLIENMQTGYPFSYDEIILPIAKEIKPFLPVKSKRLSPIHQDNFINTSYSIRLNKRKICLIKDSFSYKTRRNRSNEINKFKRAGGEIRPSSEFNAEDLVNIYIDLYQKRWNYSHSEEQKKHLIEIYTELREHIFGNVLLINGTPCAYDFVLRAESPKWISFDAINGGYDPEYAHLSVGSVLMWINIQEAKALCQQGDKTMRYSLGNPTFEYKNRWCETLPLGKILF
ncbi:conserved hypothetical protein [Xenorhabdus nematophila F1]|uniref:GNAT family N-acetyltransferase n=1 Tax=Xenorhabdus nematophila TaxID=628 RepID=UPI00032759A5|nr:GNAT family N-acetyltransferase [Xenorhabdus nematophila]CCW30446.1 conserved hypothetical protein [Xenorhabdus nematophila F1]